MSAFSQNPQPISSTRAFTDLAAAIDRGVSADRAAELLANFRAAVEHDVRWSIAEDFTRYGRVAESLTWGEANLVAREGLCTCRGGDKSCGSEVGAR